MIPPDNLLARITPEVLRSYMQDAAACNFNFIRLWGGGFYEDDALFDACDELGIALMFEFKFANTSYPSFDEKFIANVKAELEDQILRVRHHPSIAIWSGNNEIRSYVGYAELFDQVIGRAVRQLAPGQPYQKSSGGAGAPDYHDWGLGHGGNPFSRYAQNHGFVAEFGVQSYLEPASTRTFATDADLAAGVGSPILHYHELSAQDEIQKQVLRYFGKAPDKLDDLSWLSQIVQAFGLRFAVEHWRRDRPHSTAVAGLAIQRFLAGANLVDDRLLSSVEGVAISRAAHVRAGAGFRGCGCGRRGKVDIHVINDRLTGGKASLSLAAGRRRTERCCGITKRPSTFPPTATMVAETVT